MNRWFSLVIAILTLLPGGGIAQMGPETFVIGRSNAPLIEGTWEIAAQLSEYNNQRAEIGHAVLVERDGATLTKMTHIMANLSVPPYGSGWVYKDDCERDDTHHRVRSANIPGRDQDCYFINHITIKLDKGVFRKSRDYLLTNGINIPLNMVMVRYRFASRDNVLEVGYYFNPEAYGFAPPVRADWSSSDWHPNRIGEDPRKVAFIEKLKAWSAEWYPTVRAGFERR